MSYESIFGIEHVSFVFICVDLIAPQVRCLKVAMALT